MKTYYFSVSKKNMMVAVKFCNRIGVRFSLSSQAEEEKCFFVVEVANKDKKAKTEALSNILEGIGEQLYC